MRTVRRFAAATFGIACLHVVFGAIVRISGSGMGCGDHWPKCYGAWFPPFSRPDLVVEVSHRYLASILLLALLATLGVAWRRRAEAGVGGRGGVLRMAALGVGLGFGAALLGAVTVRFANAPLATLAHWTVAMSLVATTIATLIRAGGLGGTSARLGDVSRKTTRGALMGATMALLTVVMGGLTAKYPGAAVSCRGFPLCGRNADVAAAAVHVQLAHRVLAFVVVLHLIGLAAGVFRRREAPVARRAAATAAALGVLQLVVAAAMVLGHLPPVLRSLHEATGVSVWLAAFTLAYLARIGSGSAATVPLAGVPASTRAARDARASAAQGLAGELAPGLDR
jgi:heme A synthase